MIVWSDLKRRVMIAGILILVWTGGGARGVAGDGNPCSDICREAVDCLKGCLEWRSGCEQICGRDDGRACDGCRWAVAHHLEVMRRKVGSIPAPSVVPGSVGSREVVLTWPTLTIPRQQAEDNSTLAVQWRLEKRQHETDWFDADTTDIVDGSQRKQVKVLGLVPYTSYQFRLVAELGAGHGRHTLANSPPSVGVATEPEGPPATPPSVLSVRQLPNLNINITFVPPEFPNGEIFYYRLYIKETPETSSFYFAAKEIKPSSSLPPSAKQSYTTGPMSCNTTYNVKLSAVNPAGESSNASHQFATTCPWSPSITSIPYALFSSGNSVFRKDIRGGDFIWDLHVEMIQMDETIVSFDLHQRLEYLYICTKSGRLHRASLSSAEAGFSDHASVGNPEELTMRMMGPGEAGRVVTVAVDWLNDKLYFLLETSGSRTFWSIAYCDMMASNCILMERQFLGKPEDFKVDPFHGYMYWMQRWEVAGKSKAALYRMDLREEGGCGNRPVEMIKGTRFGSFVVSFSQYALFVPILDRNQMWSVSLSEGFPTTVVHQNYSGKRGFNDVKAMVMYDGTYVWTSQGGFNVEEYHPDEKVYSFGLMDDTIHSDQMVLYHPVAQPTPAPVNHVENVQVIFGATRASIKWTEPQVGGDEGCAAWRAWLYRVRVNNKVYDNVVEYDNATMENISRDGTFAINTLYSVQVQAYSEGGSGPWSIPFTSSTWSTKETPLFFWSNTESMYSMNLFGHNMKPVGRNTGNASNIAWHSESDSIFWIVRNNVYRKIVSQDKPVIVVSENWTIDGMAVDYFAKKLYYSVPSLQRISRVSLSGDGRMSLPLTTVAKNLAIDSSLARICWISLRNYVECSYLDGSNRQIIKKIGMWEEQKIVTMALDPKKHIVYYIIYNPISENRYAIYKKSIEHPDKEQIVAVLSAQKVDGPMHFRSNKLFYVEDMSYVVTHDVIGMGKSRILLNDRLVDFTITSVKSDFYPANMDGSAFVVVPDPVKEKTIRFIGKSSNFSLTWDPVDNVNYGVVQYEVRMFSKSWTVHSNSMIMLDKVLLEPFTPVNVSVMAFTRWARSTPVTASLLTPSSVPSKPQQVRVFWTPVNDTSTMFTIRWKEPRKLNGRLLHYALRCMDSVSATDACLGTMVGPGVTSVTKLMPSSNRYRVTVAGVTGVGRGEYSDTIETSGSWIRPVPRVVMGVSQRPPAIVIADADTGTSTQHQITSQPEHVAFLHKENVVFTVDRDGRIARLELSSGRSREILYLEQGVVDISIDWLGHYLYWAVDEADVSYIRRIDLNKDRPDQQDILNTMDHIHDISYHPSGQLFYTAEEDNVSKLYVTRLNVNGRASKPMIVTGRGRRSVQASDRCDCPSIQSIRDFVVLPNNDPEDNQVVRLALRDSSTGFIHLADWQLCKCRRIAETDPSDVIKLDADLTNVYVFSSRQRMVRMIDLERDSLKSLDMTEITSFGVACQHCQRITQVGCLLTRAAQLPIHFEEKQSSSVVLKLPSPKPRESCKKPIPLPSTNYTVYYAPEMDDQARLCDKDRSTCSKLGYYNQGNYGNRIVEVKKLKPNTKYAFYVAIENIYTQMEDSLQTFEIAAWVTTLEGAPSAPRDFVADVMSPTEILVTWKPPIIIHSDSIKYEIHWKSEGYIQGKKKNGYISTDGLDISIKYKNGEIRRSLLTDLVPSQVYTVWLIAKSRTDVFNESSRTDSLRVKTFSQPNKLMKLGAGPRAINISWTSPSEDIVKDHMILFYPKNDHTTPHSKIFPEKPVVTQPSQTYIYNILSLSPGVTYIMKIKVSFKTNPKHYYIWPKDDSQQFETVQDYPLTPGVPYFADSSTYGKVNITWKENDENVESYELQSLYIVAGHPNESTVEHLWTRVYFDAKNYYLVTGLYNGTYSFRVKAKNRFGFSNYSEPSEPRDIDKIRMSQYIYGENNQTVLQTIIGVSIALLSLGFFIFCIVVHKSRRNMDKKVAWDAIRPTRAPDLELANIRVFPLSPGIGNNANNPMYLIDIPTDEDLSVITKIKRSQITLSKFLGSGAFGEVFEGLVREPDSEDATKIAVKTLRKGANDSEKIEFLKEAKLMWNFKHDHILNLIAICLDNDPNFLILELMEGGDLLSYLRTNRPNALNSGLSVGDQVSMCLDVAKGCEYLEQMHYVHRDIAARNCLVSSTDPDKRRVKIGDFGLARDIYKNDYYKKEGEGLLPVRWMAPESLMDGVFTTQSDVWSFGVVLWEILTMGAKPYPAMSNVEVLQYVRSGGRLQQPVGSPARLHTIMSSCWDYKPDKRPTFKMCVEEIDSILDYADQLNEMSTSYVPFIAAGYLSAPSVHPPSFNRMSTGSSSSSNSHYHSATTCPVSQISRNTRRTASSGLGSATPNYLQLLHDAECEELAQGVAFHHHGYHVPRSTPTPSSCGCDSRASSALGGPQGYQNLRTTHLYSCDSAGSAGSRIE